MKSAIRSLLLSSLCCAMTLPALSIDLPKHIHYKPIYTNSLTAPSPDGEWIMEGPGLVEYSEQGMTMRSLLYDDFMDEWMAMPEEERLSLGDEAIGEMMYEIALVLDPVHAEEAYIDGSFKGGHTVYWLNKWLPENIVIEYDFLNVSPAGLYINFFAANAEGKTIFSPDLNPRNGVFSQYTGGDFENYHVSFGARYDGNVRGTSHLRINPGTDPVAVAEDIVAYTPYDRHKIRIVKWKNQVEYSVDGVPYINYLEGQPDAGFLGLRQMSTSKAIYQNLTIYEIIAR